MRIRSILAILVLSFISLGLVGCGSSGSSSDFVATSADTTAPNTGDLTFNFVTAQTAFTVDADTNTLRFDFYNGVDDAPIFSQVEPFAATITVENVPVSARTVIITGIDAEGFPLYTITQSIDVTPGENTVVDGINNAVPVTLSELRLASGSVFDLDLELTEVNVPVGGTTQVYLFALYSDGSVLLVGDSATYSIDPNGPLIASVNENALVTGLTAGTSRFIAQFAGQTLNVLLSVNDPNNANFASLSVNNETPIVMNGGDTVQLAVLGTDADGMTFGVPSDSENLAFSIDGDSEFTVSDTGLISFAQTNETGLSATVTVTYTNANATTVDTEVPVSQATAAP